MSEEIPGRPLIGLGAIVWKDDAVLLIRRGKPPRKGLWESPGGRQEWGETIFEGVRREIREEAEITIRILGLVAVLDLMGADYHYTVIDLQADWQDGDLQAGDDALEARWVELSRLSDYLLPAEQIAVIELASLKRAAYDPTVPLDPKILS